MDKVPAPMSADLGEYRANTYYVTRCICLIHGSDDAEKATPFCQWFAIAQSALATGVVGRRNLDKLDLPEERIERLDRDRLDGGKGFPSSSKVLATSRGCRRHLGQWEIYLSGASSGLHQNLDLQEFPHLVAAGGCPRVEVLGNGDRPARARRLPDTVVLVPIPRATAPVAAGTGGVALANDVVTAIDRER